MCKLIISILLLIPSITYAFNDEPPCFKELSESFFVYTIVSKALSLHNVDVSQWVPIHTQLTTRSRDAYQLIRQRADHLGLHNPLHYPFQPKAAATLMYQVLYEIFVSVMVQVNVVNISDLRDIFLYIERENAERVNACLTRKERY